MSDEAATYRPEFEWIAETLREAGRRVYCVHPGDLMTTDDAVLIPVDGAPERVDVIPIGSSNSSTLREREGFRLDLRRRGGRARGAHAA